VSGAPLVVKIISAPLANSTKRWWKLVRALAVYARSNEDLRNIVLFVACKSGLL
jgi:hypothetical protein